MSYLFSGCYSLTFLNLSNVNTNNINNMFFECSSLTSLNLSNYNTNNVNNLSKMFSYCSYLTKKEDY